MVHTTIYIKTFGCSLNHSDSEVMSGLLKDAGYDVITDYIDETNKSISSQANIGIVIINSCTVKNLAESKFFKELRKWKSRDVKILVAGCITQAEPGLLQKELSAVSVIGTRRISNVVDIVNKLVSGRIVHDISNDLNERLNLPKIRRTEIIEILPISEGCMSQCAFCKTKLARGELLSYPKEKIIAQFKSAVLEGCKEFWITSQDNGCYGFDIYRKDKYFLPQLLNDLLSIDGDFRIRLGMSNPDHIDRIKDDLVETFKHPKMFKFLHVPVQSGNDAVLRNMKRSYTIKEFHNIITLFRKKIPGITISTDIIVGFPGESNAEFNDTLKFLKDVKFDVLNFSKFSMRKGTAAQKMKQLPGKLVKDRTEVLKKLFIELFAVQNNVWLHRECSILIDEYAKNGELIGRNDYYKQIMIKDASGKIKIGDFVKVKIVQMKDYVLIGEEIIKDKKIKKYDDV